MLDMKIIRNNKEIVKKNLKSRNSDFDLENLIAYDKKRREKVFEIEKLKSLKNLKSKEIAILKNEKKDANNLIKEMGEISQTIKTQDSKVKILDEEILKLQLLIPNILSGSVPIGKDEFDNKVIRKWGKITEKSFLVLPHWEIGENLNILDFERGVKLSGSRFVALKGVGSKLERALINFMLDIHTNDHGYTEINPPLMVKKETMLGSGQLPKFEEDAYKTTDGMYLIPTAEVPVVNFHSNEILDEEQLPIKYTAFTPCFRKEAGSYGKDLKGLIRLHQFEKVELIKFTKPENSYEELEKLTNDAEKILQLLKLPYRVVSLCSGDVGFCASKTYDLEVYLPSEGQYREISSCSNTTDFQSRRCKIKYRTKDKKSEFVHILNGSGLAVGRTMVAILENYQNEDGSITIPEVLLAYMNGIKSIL